MPTLHFPPNVFVIPSLPKALYQQMETFRKSRGISQRDTIRAALVWWLEMAAQYPESVDEWIKKALTKFPG